MTANTISESAKAKARDFIDNEKQFQLGFLPTEQSDPITATLEMERIGKDESMKFFVISTGLVKGKDGEPSKDTTHPIEAGAKAFARLFIEDVTNRKLSVAKMFKFNRTGE